MSNYLKVNTKQNRNFTRNGPLRNRFPLAVSCELPLRRHAAVPVEFLATLAIETVLNRQHCGEFFHRLWRVKDLSLLEIERGQYLSFLESEREHFQVFMDKSSQGFRTHVSGLR